MPVATTLGAWFALAVIVIIGVQMLFQRERRREDGGSRTPLGQNVDPADLRRVRPQTKRLTGTALIVSACIIIGALRTPLGLG